MWLAKVKTLLRPCIHICENHNWWVPLPPDLIPSSPRQVGTTLDLALLSPPWLIHLQPHISLLSPHSTDGGWKRARRRACVSEDTCRDSDVSEVGVSPPPPRCGRWQLRWEVGRATAQGGAWGGGGLGFGVPGVGFPIFTGTRRGGGQECRMIDGGGGVAGSGGDHTVS
jgi:hypothetical protein